jgi:hypothetical protein
MDKWITGMTRLLASISRIIYIFSTLALMALGLAFIAYATWSLYDVVARQSQILPAMLDAVGLLIIALAVSDVGRFLLEEELVKESERATTSEIRRTLAKFMTIVIIAASLHALLFIFEAGRGTVGDLLYPVALLGSIAALLAVLGLYQRLSHAAEHERRLDVEKGREVEPE